jgi:hypothetical protein
MRYRVSNCDGVTVSTNRMFPRAIGGQAQGIASEDGVFGLALIRQSLNILDIRFQRVSTTTLIVAISMPVFGSCTDDSASGLNLSHASPLKSHFARFDIRDRALDSIDGIGSVGKQLKARFSSVRYRH